MSINAPSTNLSRAIAAAREYASPLSNPARRFEIADLIDHLVGCWVWDGRRHRTSWPREVAQLAGEPERHLRAMEDWPMRRTAISIDDLTDADIMAIRDRHMSGTSAIPNREDLPIIHRARLAMRIIGTREMQDEARQWFVSKSALEP